AAHGAGKLARWAYARKQSHRLIFSPLKGITMMENNETTPGMETAGRLPRMRSAGISPQILPYLALVSGVLALTMSGLFVRWANAPGTVTSFYRMAVAALVLTPVVLRPGARQKLPSGKLLLLPLLAGLFTALDHGAWSTSIGLTRVGTATLLNNVAPLWVALFAALFWRERLSPRFWLGLALTLTGVAIVFGNDLLLQPHFGGGDLLALVSSLFYCAYFLVTQRARQSVATLPYVWLVTVASGIFLLTWNVVTGKPLSGYPPLTYLIFLGAGLFSQIIGYFSVSYALGHLPASTVSPSMLAQPVLTAVLAIPLAGEMLLPGQWLGAAVVLAGIYLVNISHQADPGAAVEARNERAK
ncbi:MAG TPA: DMT family transporter, partial [Anaerolineaceae bacterium]